MKQKIKGTQAIIVSNPEQESHFRALNEERERKAQRRAERIESLKAFGVEVGGGLLIVGVIALILGVVPPSIDMWRLHAKGWTVERAIRAIEQSHQPCDQPRTIIVFTNDFAISR